MEQLLKKIKDFVRGSMYEVAKLLDEATNGLLKPDHVTLISLLGHLVIVFALIEGRFGSAAVMLVGFGLLDALDGALAKYQNSVGPRGELIDSVADRFKEMLLYAGLAYYFTTDDNELGAFLSVIALGVSFAVTFVKARGEVSYLSKHHSKAAAQDINRRYGIGLFGYEVRMAVLVVAFAFSQPMIGVYIVAAGSVITFIRRGRNILADLSDTPSHQNKESS